MPPAVRETVHDFPTEVATGAVCQITKIKAESGIGSESNQDSSEDGYSSGSSENGVQAEDRFVNKLKMRRSPHKRNDPYNLHRIVNEKNAKNANDNQVMLHIEESVTELNLGSNQTEKHDFSEFVDTLIEHVKDLVNLDEYKDHICYPEASRVACITIVMVRSLQLTPFLTIFGHSINCAVKNCSSACRMFRRIRNHVTGADHSCAMMHVYGQILRMHLDTCTKENGACGMKTCKSLRDMRVKQQFSVLPRDFFDQEKHVKDTLTQACTPEPTQESTENFDECIIKEEIIHSELAIDLSKKDIDDAASM